MRYELMWRREISLTEEIKDAWEGHARAGDLRNINTKLRSVMASLKSWSKNKFGAVNREIEKLRNEIAHMQSLPAGEMRNCSGVLAEGSMSCSSERK